MNNKINVERLLPYADKALNDAGILVNGKVPQEYLGYVAAFGATVINMGIESALLYYKKDEQKYLSDKEDYEKNPIKYKENISKVYRVKVVIALTHILKESKEFGETQIDLVEWVRASKDNTLELYNKTGKIVNASVALKLMIRTYPIQKNNDEQQENAQ